MIVQRGTRMLVADVDHGIEATVANARYSTQVR
jgi:hypothetical protein